ncbi:SecY-interacting protein Syd [Peribacillus frigoritolerans]|uniref:SecY-interacting protein Syd n=1 Tax=Peribacillus frigoritolerans TaxID=450367 RepID=UPI0039A3DE2C
MGQYFSMRHDLAEEGMNFLFKTSVIEELNSIIYESEVDEEDYITWKPVEKTTSHDLKELEENLGVGFHKSIIEYFNSYWFANLDGFLNDFYIKLDGVLPNFEFDSFRGTLEGYKSNHNNRLENIPLGIEGNGLLVVIDNENGKVKLEDFERNSFEVISESIEALISKLRIIR